LKGPKTISFEKKETFLYVHSAVKKMPSAQKLISKQRLEKKHSSDMRNVNKEGK
jgi:hypothetical protein